MNDASRPGGFASWGLGWIEAGMFLDDRGQEEASRWLREAV